MGAVDVLLDLYDSHLPLDKQTFLQILEMIKYENLRKLPFWATFNLMNTPKYYDFFLVHRLHLNVLQLEMFLRKSSHSCTCEGQAGRFYLTCPQHYRTF